MPARRAMLKLFLDVDGSGKVLADGVVDLMDEVGVVLAAADLPTSVNRADFGIRRGPLGGDLWVRCEEEFFGRLRAGELEFASVDWRTPALDWGATLRLSTWTDPGAVVQLSVTMNLDAQDTVVCDAAAERLAMSLARSGGPVPVWGAVVLDRLFPGQTPYDRWTGTGESQAMKQIRGLVRGYYWANLLSAGHLAHWGGREPARAAAIGAGLLAEEVGEGLLVRCAGPVSEFDDGKLAAVKAFLRPILMPMGPGYFDKLPLRILPD